MTIPKLQKTKILSVIAMTVIVMVLTMFAGALFIPIVADISISTVIITTMGNFVMLILGYFYGASDSKQKQKEDEPEV